MCPSKFVPSPLYPGGGMLHDLIRFRAGVYTEVYLATHDRRTLNDSNFKSHSLFYLENSFIIHGYAKHS